MSEKEKLDYDSEADDFISYSCENLQVNPENGLVIKQENPPEARVYYPNEKNAICKQTGKPCAMLRHVQINLGRARSLDNYFTLHNDLDRCPDYHEDISEFYYKSKNELGNGFSRLEHVSEISPEDPTGFIGSLGKAVKYFG